MKSVIKLSLPTLTPLKRETKFEFGSHERIIIPQSYGYKVLRYEDVMYLKAEGNYTLIMESNGNSTLVCQTLSKLNVQLDYRFVKVHRSTIINLLYVKAYNIGDSEILLQDDVRFAVSRSRKGVLRELFNSNKL